VSTRETIVEPTEPVLAEVRREEVEALATLRGMDLADAEVMAGTWRTWWQCGLTEAELLRRMRGIQRKRVEGQW
jgi:hypothetical protein